MNKILTFILLTCIVFIELEKSSANNNFEIDDHFNTILTGYLSIKNDAKWNDQQKQERNQKHFEKIQTIFKIRNGKR